MSTTFLSQLVAMRQMQAEPVATALVTHLLKASSGAAAALATLAGEIHAFGNFEHLHFSEQSATADGEGRPDIVGVQGEVLQLLVEAKFDAGLTSAQSGTGYVDKLAPRGLLLFLVPQDRISALWPKLLAGPGGRPPAAIAPVDRAISSGTAWLSTPLTEQRMLAVTSWEVLLRRFGDADISHEMSSDLEQLRDLVQTQMASEWIPVSNDDLSERTGRQLHRLRDALRRAADVVSGGKSALGTNNWGPARWVTDDKAHKLFWAGIRIPTWGRLGISPLWAVYVHRDPVKRNTARTALAPLRSEGGPGVFELDQITIGIPLIVPAQLEIDAVEDDLVRQLATIRSLLLAAGTSSEDADVSNLAPPTSDDH